MAYLDAILGKPWIPAETGRRLVHAVAVRLGDTTDGLIAQSGATSHILPFESPRAVFVARNGIYLKAADPQRQRFKPCSNFNVRLLESWIENEEAVFHRLLLVVGQETVEFEIPEKDFQSRIRLMAAITKAAVRGKLSSLPILHDPEDLRHLPAIVKATRLQDSTETAISGKLGFDYGTFRGIDFTATATGISKERNIASGTPAWIKPEMIDFPFSGSDHLALKANELGTWLSRMEKREQRAAGAVVFAVLHWLHQASRNLESFLLVPSREHLELMGQVCGLDLIEMGKLKRHPTVPRLMASNYARISQFRSQGRVVAAIEEPARKIDRTVTVLVHSIKGIEIPAPPSSFLSLLAYSCLGASSMEEAITKLSNLPETPTLRESLRSSLDCGRWYLAPEGLYLETFLAAVERHYGFKESIIDTKRGPLLPRKIVPGLTAEHGYSFGDMRLIDEFREISEVEQPTTYGKEHMSAFVLPERVLVDR